MLKKYQPRKYFLPLASSNPDETKQKSFVFRKTIYVILLLLVISVIYTIYGMSQAKRMAADACIRATQGMPLEDFLSKFPEKDYRMIRRAEYIMIVPKSGMGRNHCTVFHDGQRITGSKTGFND